MNRFVDGWNEGIPLNAEYEREWGLALYFTGATMYIPAVAYKAIAVLVCGKMHTTDFSWVPMVARTFITAPQFVPRPKPEQRRRRARARLGQQAAEKSSAIGCSASALTNNDSGIVQARGIVVAAAAAWRIRRRWRSFSRPLSND
jgi:hypothetical protein